MIMLINYKKICNVVAMYNNMLNSPFNCQTRKTMLGMEESNTVYFTNIFSYITFGNRSQFLTLMEESNISIKIQQSAIPLRRDSEKIQFMQLQIYIITLYTKCFLKKEIGGTYAHKNLDFDH